MTTLANLHRTVQATIAEKRLGVPVFVRYQLHTNEKANGAVPRLARTVATVRQWLGQALSRLYAQGSANSGQVTLTLEFDGAATALVSWTNSAAQGDGVDLMLIGNQGALYHDAGTGILWDEPATPTTEAPDKMLVNQIQQALRTGRPITVKRGS